MSTNHAHCEIQVADEEARRFARWAKSQLSRADHTLRKARSQCAQINRLPPELMINIFQLKGTSNELPAASLRRAILLSGVCSHWRRLITRTTSFWSLIPLGHSKNSEKITLLCLQRARKGPIEIVANSRKSSPWAASSALAPHVQQIRSLSLSAGSLDQIHSVTECLLKLKAPSLLEELSVTFHGRTNFGTPAPIFPDSMLASALDILNTLTRGLHVLNLRGASIDWRHFAFDELVTLRLNGSSVLGGSIASLDQLAHIATVSPKLRVLELRSVGLEGSRTISRAFSMNSLKMLRLCDLKFGVLHDILQLISLGSCEVELFVNDFSFTATGRHLSKDLIDSGISQLKLLSQKLPSITTLGLGPSQLSHASLWLKSVWGLLQHLNTLSFEDCELTAELLSIIPPPQTGIGHWPQIRTVRMRDVRIVDPDAFKLMLSNHSIEHVDMAKCWLARTSGNSHYGFTPINFSSPLYEWLDEAIPKLSFSLDYSSQWAIW